MKVATCPLGAPSARVPSTLVSVTQSQPKATSSPIRLPEKEKGIVHMMDPDTYMYMAPGFIF